MSSSVTHLDGSREEFIDNGDGTGTRTEYDAGGEVLEVTQLDDLPILPTVQQSITAQLDQMSPEQGATVGAVLGWIASLSEGQTLVLLYALGDLIAPAEAPDNAAQQFTAQIKGKV